MLFRCKYCGWQGPIGDFEIDHDPPVSRPELFGFLTPKIEYICSGCNRQKGDKTSIEYILWRILNSGKANSGPK